MNDPLLTTAAAAKALSVSERTLRAIYERGEIAYVRVSPRRIAFRQSDIDKYIADRVVKPRRRPKGRRS